MNRYDAGFFSYFKSKPIEAKPTTMKETSKDVAKEKTFYITNSTLPVINFDEAMGWYSKMKGKSSFPSNDALFFDLKGKHYAIEFKNSPLKNINKQRIYEKISYSVFMSLEVLGLTLEEYRKKTSYILVYNDSSSIDKITKISYKMADESRFGLEKFKDFLYNEVHLLSKEEFEQLISNWQ